MAGRINFRSTITSNEKFEYRILVDDSVTMNIGSKTAQWIEMDVASALT